jgi:uncharacterized protein (TIGR03435 family)
MKSSHRFYLILIVIRLAAQGTGASAVPEFDVASLKAVSAAENGPSKISGGPGTSDPGRVSYSRVTLATLIARAYGVADDQVIGPASLSSDRYTLLATLPPASTVDQLRLMLQHLLSERMGMNVHHESREYGGYQLVISKKGVNAKNLKRAADTLDQQDNAALRENPTGGAPAPMPALALDRDGCPVIKADGAQMGARWGTEACSRFQHFSMAEFGKTLGGIIQITDGIYGKPVRLMDRTGLDGVYDFTLTFTFIPFGLKNIDPSGPTLYEALEQQIGLKLEQVKEPLDTIVVDRIDKVPNEN